MVEPRRCTGSQIRVLLDYSIPCTAIVWLLMHSFKFPALYGEALALDSSPHSASSLAPLPPPSMAVAGLSARGLLFSLHLQQSCKLTSTDRFFAALRIQSTKNFPRGGAAVVRSPGAPPHCFAVKASPAASSSSSDAVLLSSKECPDGTILFRFGSPGQRISEDEVEPNEDNYNGAGAATEGVSEHAAGEITEIPESQRTDIESPSNGYPVQGASSDLQNPTPVSAGHARSDMLNGPAVIQLDDVKEKTDAISVVTTVKDDSFEAEKGIVEKEERRLRSGAAMRPHPSKVASGGEDAYLIEGTTWVGVADGVGGWAPSGIDAGIYSRELMTNCVLLARQEDGVPDPKGVIIRSVERSKAAGTCTAVLGAVHKQTLYVANIGDSGFLVVRNGKTLMKSTPMQRGFNFPYQIGGVSEGDDPSIAETYEVSVSVGDVVVLATDGLFDNLYEREIVDVVQAGRKKAVKPEDVAMWLVKLAQSMGIETHGRSPFSDAAMAAGYSYIGGKLDDVTVVVSYVE